MHLKRMFYLCWLIRYTLFVHIFHVDQIPGFHRTCRWTSFCSKSSCARACPQCHWIVLYSCHISVCPDYLTTNCSTFKSKFYLKSFYSESVGHISILFQEIFAFSISLEGDSVKRDHFSNQGTVITHCFWVIHDIRFRIKKLYLWNNFLSFDLEYY